MNLGDTEVTITCPQCSHSFRLRLSATADGYKSRCPRCGVEFRGKGSELAQAQRALADLTRSLRKLGSG